MSARTLFITGTDTGVGKTVVTALLASLLIRHGRDVGVMKPVASGGVEKEEGLRSQDLIFLRERLRLTDPEELINPVCFREPLAPAIAARREGREVDLGILDKAYEQLKRSHEFLLIEGIGGLLVPLRDRFAVADLALRWETPVLVVASPRLGTINHTCLTLSHARAHDIKTAGFLFNAARETDGGGDWKSSAACIDEFCGVPFWGMLPFAGELSSGGSAWESLLGEADRQLAPRLEQFFE
ncbi:MAG: dethiobiotin synthase [Candidatus Aureabacteria bacterium]|nr:dethiobiotin synthase [Candidatus Auribacterota bacterium]